MVAPNPLWLPDTIWQRTDKQIDDLVYQLYGLTSQEIGIVEKSGSIFIVRASTTDTRNKRIIVR